MGANTKIQWCDFTFNPWQGCTKVSPGCLNCYAEARDIRFADGVHWGKGAPRQRTSASNWREPLKWNREFEHEATYDATLRGTKTERERPRVFCASLSDWLDNEVPIEWLVDFLNVVRITTNLDWLLLTKRPKLFIERIAGAINYLSCGAATKDSFALIQWLNGWQSGNDVPYNIWFGTSVEDQARARERIPALLRIPARIRFLSCEPLLGPVDLSIDGLWKSTCEQSARDFVAHADDGKSHPEICRDQADRWMDARKAAQNVDWVIIGGESGTGARPFNLDWARSLVTQCRAADVAPFVKQLGRVPFEHLEDAFLSGQKIADACDMPVELNDKKGGDMTEWPVELRVREFPATRERLA